MHISEVIFVFRGWKYALNCLQRWQILNLNSVSSLIVDCRDYLKTLRWSNGLMCSKCGRAKVWETADLLIICQECSFRTSLTSGTIFHQTRKPLLFWFRAMWLCDQPEKWSECIRASKSSRIGQLSHGLDLASQAEIGDGKL